MKFLEHWPRSATGMPQPPPGQEAHPVVYLTFHDANLFARWKGMRIPTKTEWESAAQFGVEGGYPFGVWQNLRANTLEMGMGHTTPVGLFENGKSFLQIYDLAGNVGEMTVRGESGIVVKGGSFLQYRTRIFPTDEEPLLGFDFAAPDVGFRCAADAIPFLMNRVLRSDIPFDVRVRSLAKFLKKSGAAGRQLLEQLVLENPQAKTVVNAALSAQY